MKKSLFELSHTIVSNQLNAFSSQLDKLVQQDGTIIENIFIDCLNEHLDEFHNVFKKVKTNYLVVKLSKESSDTYIIKPKLTEKTYESFNNKVRFIEEVFPKIRNTELFFDKGQRIITFCHSKQNARVKNLLNTCYKDKLISYTIKENDPRLVFTNELLIFAASNKNLATVEAEFCREASYKSRLMKGIKWASNRPLKLNESDLKALGAKGYGFGEDITKLLLLIKWMVFPNILVLFYPTPGTGEYGQGGIVWGIELSSNPSQDLFWCIESYAALLCSFIDKILQTKQQLRTKLEARKAIIAEIMNRNYAHHIGSHISLRSTFDKILLRLDKKVDSLVAKETAAIAQMIKKLDQYKDERNEFIAGLNNEPIFESSYFYQDVILPLLENTLFMDNIAKNEGICYINKNGTTNDDVIDGENSNCRLKIKVYFQKQDADKAEKVIGKYYKNDTEIFNSFNIPYFNEVDEINNPFYDKKIIDNDFLVSLPGSLGKHCIYSILENFIRNTAKHSYNKEKNKKYIEIIIKIREDKEHYEVELTDNISDGSKSSELLEKIKTSILERKNLGISDMKINACLLAGEKLTDDNMKKILSVEKSENDHIVYKFKLLKPKEVALIGGEWKEELKKVSEGIIFYKNLNDYLQNCAIKNFRFGIIDNAIEIDSLIINHNQLPFRVIMLNDIPEVNTDSLPRKNFVFAKSQILKNSADIYTLISKCWDLWLSSFGQSNIEMITYLEQGINETPTEEWNVFITLNKNKFCAIVKPQVWYNDSSKNLVQKEIALNIKDAFYILYDRHGKMAERLKVSLLEKNFYEPIDKNNLDFNTIFNTKDDKLDETFIYELAEAGLLRVLVIDERAAEASTELIPDDKYYCKINERGFGQYDNGFNKKGIFKFDACWAAKIFIATHICYDDKIEYESLNKKIDDKKYHTLKIKFRVVDGKIVIDAETKFMQRDEEVEYENGWTKDGNKLHDIEPKNEPNFNVDLLIIHRTILKKILEDTRWEGFINKLDVSRILVVTGGGVVESILQKDEKIKVISTDILRNHIIGSRPAKFNLIKIVTS